MVVLRAIIQKYLTKGLVAVVVVLIVTSGALWLSNKAAVAKYRKAMVNYAQVYLANQENLAALEALKAEKRTNERLLSQRLEVQRRIAEEAKERIRQQNEAIEELRKRHEDVDNYLSIPVPDALVDWLRGYNRSQD